LQAPLVRVRACIPDVLIPIRLGEEEPQADATCQLGIGSIETLGSCDSRCQVNNVLERSGGVLRVDGRRLHDAEDACILIEKRLVVGIEIHRGDGEFIRSSDFGRKRVGEILECAYHVVARKIECLSRQVRQLLPRIHLCAPLAQDRSELLQCVVVPIERLRL
jgi:hypothetical protein